MMLCPEGPDDPRATFPGLEWRHTRAEVAQMTSFPAKEAGTLVEDNMNRHRLGHLRGKANRIPGTSYPPPRL
jgi:hypothetical protein